MSPEHEIPPDGGEGEDEPPPKSDRDALLRFWKKARADFNRKYHKGEPMTDTSRPAVTMAAKVTGEGPLHLDADEADALGPW